MALLPLCTKFTVLPLAMSKLFQLMTAFGVVWVTVNTVLVRTLPGLLNVAAPSETLGGVNGRQALVLQGRFGNVPAGNAVAACAESMPALTVSAPPSINALMLDAVLQARGETFNRRDEFRLVGIRVCFLLIVISVRNS